MSAIFKIDDEKKQQLPHLAVVKASLGMDVLTSLIDDGAVCYWLGDAGDMSVGIPSFEFSPFLPSVDALNQWCLNHHEAIDTALALAQESGDEPQSLAHLELPKNSVALS
ncbi:hypothetical protein JE959_001595 [Aeromonas veronii]|nr:hypothetical protein [Aeromonas veronii]